MAAEESRRLLANFAWMFVRLAQDEPVEPLVDILCEHAIEYAKARGMEWPPCVRCGGEGFSSEEMGACSRCKGTGTYDGAKEEPKP